MPKSFLVRLRPSAETTTYHDQNCASYDSKQSFSSDKSSNVTVPNQPTTMTATNETFSTQENHIQSHYNVVMSSPSSQSNSEIVMKPYESNQSSMNTARVNHHLRSGLEMTMPAPKYQQIIHYLPSSNNAWNYPRLDYMQLHKFPELGERLLYTGEASHPVCAKDNTTYRTEQCYQMPPSYLESKREKVSDVSTVPTAFNEFFSIEKILGTQHPARKTNSATAVDSLLPRDQTLSEHRTQKPFGIASKNPDQNHENGGNSSQKGELSQQSNTDESNTIISRQTALVDPDNLKSQQSSPEKIHTCTQCNKTFNRASNLRAHMKTHSDHKPYKCDYCGKGFHQKIDKRIHHYTHTGEKPHKCTKCGRGFKQLTHLNYHMRTHSDTHMYHCTYCGKGFNQKGNLQAHIYGHTGQRPFKCEICSKGFTLRSTLNTHLRTHAPKKPFVCEHCNKAFYQKNALKMHHIASHPIINGKSIL